MKGFMEAMAKAHKFRRDRMRQGQTGCFWCGCNLFAKGPNRLKATIEHVVPRSMGGSDRDENLELACFGCQQARGKFSQLRVHRLEIGKLEQSNPEQFTKLLNRWAERVEKWRWLRPQWAALYRRRLRGARLAACLQELTDVFGEETNQ